jgi:hypothetical protein
MTALRHLCSHSVSWVAIKMSDALNSNKRPLDDVDTKKEGPVTKKLRVTEPGRFRNVIVSIGEEHDATSFYLIEGDAEGREPFEALMREAKELSDKKEEPLADLLIDAIPPDARELEDTRPRVNDLSTRLKELVAKYHLTHRGIAPYEDSAQDWVQGVSSFMVISGFY